MNVLVACEESQTVCKEFRKRGHRAFSCDIQECSGGHPEWHIQGDALVLIDGNCTFTTTDGHSHRQNGQWDLLIAHPPCTYLTNAGARWLYAGNKLNDERFKKGLEAKAFFMKMYNADCERIAIENPVPSSVYCLPEYSQIIEPYMFGHNATKKTCLWLKGLPLLHETNNIGRPKKVYFKKHNGTLRTTCWTLIERGAKNRSKTFKGIADAMAEQWGSPYKYDYQMSIFDFLGEEND